MDEAELNRKVKEANARHREKIANDAGFKNSKEHDRYLTMRDKEDAAEALKEHQRPEWKQ